MSESIGLFTFTIGMIAAVIGAVLGSFLSYVFTRKWDRHKRKEERSEILGQMSDAFIKEFEANRKLLDESPIHNATLAGRRVSVRHATLMASCQTRSV